MVYKLVSGLIQSFKRISDRPAELESGCFLPVQVREKCMNNPWVPISSFLTHQAVDADFRAALYLCRGSGISGYEEKENQFHMCRSKWRHSPCWTASCHTLLVFRRTSLCKQQLYFPGWGPEGLLATFPWEIHRISISPSQLSPKLCLFGPTTQKHWSIPEKADVAEAELRCELDSKRETSHLTQWEVLEQQQASGQAVTYFFKKSSYWFLLLKKDSQTQSSWKH